MAIAHPTALSVTEVQQYLHDDEALVAFLPTPDNRGLDGETLSWVITKTEIHLNASPMNERVVRQFVDTLRCGLDRTLWRFAAKQCANLVEKGWEEGEPLPFRMDLAYALYYQLFEPIEQYIDGKRLFVFTPNALATLPLAVLPTQWPDFNTRLFADDFSKVDWLIRKHPSPSFLA